jgi:hypothetical protein
MQNVTKTCLDLLRVKLPAWGMLLLSYILDPASWHLCMACYHLR